MYYFINYVSGFVRKGSDSFPLVVLCYYGFACFGEFYSVWGLNGLSFACDMDYARFVLILFMKLKYVKNEIVCNSSETIITIL